MSFGRFFSAIAHQGFIGLEPEESGGGGPVTPTNAYVLEDGVTFYVAEDNVTFYVQEH